MGPDQEIAERIRLGAIAVASAVLTATLIIGAGRAMLPGHEAEAAVSRPDLVRASLP